MAEIESVEAFEDTNRRPCVEVGIRQNSQKATMVFVDDDQVLVLE